MLCQARPICVVWRERIKCGKGPLGVVECHLVLDDLAVLEAVTDLLEIHRLLLQAPPQPLDENVVELTAKPINQDADPKLINSRMNSTAELH